MAGLVVLLAVVAVSKGQDHILQRRSPLVSLPGLDQGVLAATSSDDEDLAATSGVITERALRQLAQRWFVRESEMLAKLKALLLCKRRGLNRCWAGSVDEWQAILAAHDEADFIKTRLLEAGAWCKERSVGKANWSFAFGIKRDGSKRPKHDEVPPSLYFLPLPLPKPPKHDNYAPMIISPPGAPAEAPPPPVYSEKIADDEKMIERANRAELEAGLRL